MGGFDPWNLSDNEFEAVMAEIDAELRKENDRIVGREIRGWVKFCQRFHISVELGDPVADRIVDWFKAVYGDRLNLDLDFGTSFAPVRGDSYRLRCFRLYGVIYAICSVEMLGRTLQQRIPNGPERTVINLLDDNIEGLTREMARRLSPAECAVILTRYDRIFLTFSALEGALAARHGGDDAPYMKEAFDDLREAAECVLLRTPNYGQSNWASLQVAEKVLKSYILEKGGVHGKVHRLDELCDCAYKLGLPPLEPSLISAIQCKPGVRYDSRLVSKEQALAAYDATLIVSGATAKHIKRTTAIAASKQIKIRVSGNVLVDGLMLAYQPPSPPFLFKPRL
jgi:hypothetical protein